MNIGNATVVEIVWTATTLVGFVVNAWGLVDAIADKLWLHDSGLNGRRAIVARWHVVLNIGLAYVQTAFLAAGVLAMLTPSAPNAGIREARVALQLMFLTAEPVLVYVAIQARRYRGRLLATRRTSDLELELATDEELELDDELDDDRRTA